MPLNVVIPSNLDTDFTIDVVKSKIYNNSIIIGAGVPVANPPVEEKVWLYARNDNGGVSGDYAISHIWEPSTLIWEPLGAAVDFRLTAVSVNSATGEVTFTITDPASGTFSTITTDLTNLVDVQETLTVLAEVAPGQLNYTDEDAVVNVIDVSGLRDTGQAAQRVEVIGDTFNIIPNGTDTRVVVDNVSSTATFVDGTTTSIHYTGDNVLGMSAPGDAGVVMTPDVIGVSYVMSQTTGSVTAGLVAGDTGFTVAANTAVERDSVSDTSRATSNGITDAGYNFTNVSGASPAGSGSSMAVAAPSGNQANQALDVNSTTSRIEALATSNQSFASSYSFVADQVKASYGLSTYGTNGFTSTINSVSNLTSSDLSLSSTVGAGATKTYLTLNTDGTDNYTRLGSADTATAYSYLENTSNATDQSATLTTAQSATTYSLIDLDTSATNSTVSISSFMGADNRNITVAPASIEIGAGDVAANAVGGANGDVLVRFGTGSEVRFAPIGAAIGAELNVNTGTPALELEIGGSVVDTVPLVDVLDAFNVHQFYAIP